jgi:hypothetical protein
MDNGQVGGLLLSKLLLEFRIYQLDVEYAEVVSTQYLHSWSLEARKISHKIRSNSTQES